jgi:CheY-like chemotaxis protein
MGGARRTVLVVDDDDSMRLLCRVNLELEDYRVLEAPTVAKARELLHAADVDVVLLDIAMPGLNGLDAAARVAADSPGTKVVIISMHANERYVAQALDGVLTYVGIATFGAAAEGNPVVSWYMSAFGAGFGLAAVKAVAVACAATLHLNARHAILGGLTLVYFGAAVLPWTRLLWL